MNEAGAEFGLIGGIEKRAIEIVDYDSSWPKKFERHAKRIAGLLNDRALHIEHIGSTAVPGLAAKSIIDMLLVVKDSADEAAYLPKMLEAGYELRVREPDFHEHRMLRTRELDTHVHVYSAGCREIERLLTFRDRLRTNRDDRLKYEAAKKRLAAQEWPDMNAYADAKSPVVEEIIANARRSGEISQ